MSLCLKLIAQQISSVCLLLQTFFIIIIPLQNRIEMVNGVLVIHSVNVSDAGMYQCLAENKYGTIYASAELKILGKYYWNRADHYFFSLWKLHLFLVCFDKEQLLPVQMEQSNESGLIFTFICVSVGPLLLESTQILLLTDFIFFFFSINYWLGYILWQILI